MQYKFFVDGEWKHDEHQPFVSGTYGVVNTILINNEPSIPNFTPEAPGRSNMEVDNDVAMPAVRFLFLPNFQLVFFFGCSSLFFHRLILVPLLLSMCHGVDHLCERTYDLPFLDGFKEAMLTCERERSIKLTLV